MKIACLDYPSVQGTPREAYLDVSPGTSGYDVQGVQQNAPTGNTSPAKTSRTPSWRR